jgi:hypothetical protein
MSVVREFFRKLGERLSPFFSRVLSKLKLFFFPPADAPRWQRLLPYGVLGLLTFILLTAGAYGWEYTNSPVFCGETCHTMPPEFAAYQVSPHARVACVDCHIGQGFIATRITRKAGDLKHVIKTVFSSYEYPIFAGDLRPARETCELCHYPAKFSDDSLRQIVHYANDEANTMSSIYLALRTGGGSERQGLGRGIHWHIENEVWFAAADELQQDIPYIRVVNADGTEEVYTALDSPLSEEELAGLEQVRMDCLTCHNRISHNIRPPGEAVDLALSRRQIDSSIPFIRFAAVSVLSGYYPTDAQAHEAIRNLSNYYAENYPDYYAEHADSIEQAVETVLAIYDDSVFRDQQVNWQTHPNNIGHKEWPGCFRCHDGQHVNEAGQAIRLECNLCHSIPEVAIAGVLEPVLPLATGIQPESHFSSHWINLHRFSFDQTCQACHTVTNPGGTDNSSFCSNSACHGTAWEFAALDAPGLSAIIQAEMPEPAATPEPAAMPVAPAGEEAGVPLPEPAATPTPIADPTFTRDVLPLFQAKCTACHSEAIATGGLVLDSYNGTMTGGARGPVILPGDPEDSRLVEVQRGGHFAKLDEAALELVIRWIRNGAPEN